MKYICITKYIHSFLISKYTKSFLITFLKSFLASWIWDSEPYLGSSEESNNQGIKVQFKRTFKIYSFLLKKSRQALLEIFLNAKY